MDNPLIKSVNGRLRDEHFNIELFFSIADAQHKILGGDSPGLPGGRCPTKFTLADVVRCPQVLQHAANPEC